MQKDSVSTNKSFRLRKPPRVKIAGDETGNSVDDNNKESDTSKNKKHKSEKKISSPSTAIRKGQKVQNEGTNLQHKTSNLLRKAGTFRRKATPQISKQSNSTQTTSSSKGTTSPTSPLFNNSSTFNRKRGMIKASSFLRGFRPSNNYNNKYCSEEEEEEEVEEKEEDDDDDIEKNIIQKSPQQRKQQHQKPNDDMIVVVDSTTSPKTKKEKEKSMSPRNQTKHDNINNSDSNQLARKGASLLHRFRFNKNNSIEQQQQQLQQTDDSSFLSSGLFKMSTSSSFSNFLLSPRKKGATSTMHSGECLSPRRVRHKESNQSLTLSPVTPHLNHVLGAGDNTVAKNKGNGRNVGESDKKRMDEKQRAQEKKQVSDREKRHHHYVKERTQDENRIQQDKGQSSNRDKRQNRRHHSSDKGPTLLLGSKAPSSRSKRSRHRSNSFSLSYSNNSRSFRNKPRSRSAPKQKHSMGAEQERNRLLEAMWHSGPSIKDLRAGKSMFELAQQFREGGASTSSLLCNASASSANKTNNEDDLQQPFHRQLIDVQERSGNVCAVARGDCSKSKLPSRDADGADELEGRSSMYSMQGLMECLIDIENDSE